MGILPIIHVGDRAQLAYFRQGVDKKLIKEVTRHHSDAVDKYAITSDKQREQISNIMYDHPKQNIPETVSEVKPKE